MAAPAFKESRFSRIDYAEACRDSPQGLVGYATQGERIKRLESLLRKESSAKLVTYNRYLLRYLLDHFDLDESRLKLPDSVRRLYPAELDRISEQLSSFEHEYFSFDADPFVKDVALLTHRLLPVGAEFVSPQSGLSRKVIFCGGLLQSARFLRCIAQMGSSKPLLELHMHPLVTGNFNPNGWLDTYDHLADLLLANDKFLGIQSTSWFLDPQVKTISPHLAYLREVPELCGARFFYVTTDLTGNSGALTRSTHRRRLFEAGLYRPRLYLRIWPREDLLKRGWRS